MAYVRLALSIAAGLSGAASTGVALLIYFQLRKRVVLDFAGFLLSLFFFLCGLAVPVFQQIDPDLSPRAAQMVSFAFMAAGGLLYMVAAPWFYHHLFGDTIGRVRRICYRAIAGLFAAGCVAVFADPQWTAPQILLNSLLFGMIGYGIAMIGIRMRQVGDRRLKRAMVVFFALSAGFFPLMYVDSVSPYLNGPAWLRSFDGTSLPAYFLILNSLSIALAANYFSEPPYLQNGVITNHFTGSFGLSARELEIVEATIDGHSNREIGEKLFISTKTVENHLYNIYQKTGVRNRVQLANLIRGNKAG